MVLVRARFEGGIDDSTFKIPELCRGVVGDEVELLDRIRSRRIPKQVVGYLIVIHAVEQEIVCLLAVTVDEGATAVPGSVVAVIKTARIGRYSAWRKQRQLDVVARSERKI